MLSAAAISAARASRSAPASARPSSAVDGCVPLMSARPSFGASDAGARPARASALAPGSRVAVVPGFAFADQHQRRDAPAARGRRWRPTDPRDGTTGWTRWLSSASSSSSVSTRMPENPLASTFARSAIVARTTGIGQRLADAGGMAAQQIELQLGERLVRDADVGEVAEAGVDAVDRRVALARPASTTSRAARTRAARRVGSATPAPRRTRSRRDRRA